MQLAAVLGRRFGVAPTRWTRHVLQFLLLVQLVELVQLIQLLRGEHASTQLHVVYMDIVFECALSLPNQFLGPSQTPLEALVQPLAVGKKLLMLRQVDEEPFLVPRTMLGVLICLRVRAQHPVFQGVFVAKVGEFFWRPHR